MTGQGSVDTAIEATKRGAFDYLLKPIDPDALLRVVEKAIEGSRLMRSEVILGSTTTSDQADAMVGMGQAMQAIYKAVGRVAPTDATVLIRGESGTGKELVARAAISAQLACPGVVDDRQLRSDSGNFIRERTVRTRARSVLRRRHPPDRPH